MTGTRRQVARYFGFDHIEFWVGNAKQAAEWYCGRFGFSPIAYRGLETGSREVCQHVVGQGKIVFVFTSPLRPDNAEFGAHMAKHGDGVRDVAFTVSDCRAVYERAVSRGAVSVREPAVLKDEHGEVVVASVRTYGDTVHSFVQRDGYIGVFMPGFVPASDARKNDPFVTFGNGGRKFETDLLLVDHVVGNQEFDGMTPVEEWYSDKLDFHRFWSVDDKQMHTEYSALRSVVVADDDEVIKMPINEPAAGKRKSQIEEYCDFYGGPGVQHIAILTDNILQSVAALRARGVSFLAIPPAYYEDLKKRLAHANISVKEDLQTIQDLDILVDFDEKGYLLQIFTKPVEDRPTLFIEIIQRANCSGFGVGNFKALFEAIEREQALRGNL